MAASPLVACSVALSACAGGTVDLTETSTTTTSSVATVASPATSPPEDDAPVTTEAPTLSAQEQDEMEITTTLEAYTAALDAAKNGKASIEGIYPYANGTAREQWITQVMAYEAQGLGSSNLSGHAGGVVLT